MEEDLKKEFWQLMNKLSAIDFESDKDLDSVGEIEEKLHEWGCKALGGHDFVTDQCGFWQHKFCCRCGEAQYPDLARQRCSVLYKEMGKMTEEEYLKNEKF